MEKSFEGIIVAKIILNKGHTVADPTKRTSYIIVIVIVFVIVVAVVNRPPSSSPCWRGRQDPPRGSRTTREKEGDARRFRRPPPTVEHRDRLDQCGAIGERLGIAQFLRLGKATSKA